MLMNNLRIDISLVSYKNACYTGIIVNVYYYNTFKNFNKVRSM